MTVLIIIMGCSWVWEGVNVPMVTVAKGHGGMGKRVCMCVWGGWIIMVCMLQGNYAEWGEG